VVRSGTVSVALFMTVRQSSKVVPQTDFRIPGQ